MAIETLNAGQRESARAVRAAGTTGTTVRPEHSLDRAVAQSSMEGIVVRGIISANREALSRSIEHPVFAEGRAFVRQIETRETVQVKGAKRFPSGFRRFGE